MKYLDAHCHIQFSMYDEDRDEVIAKMETAEVGGIVVGCDLESSKQAVTLVENHDHLWASIGLHPNHEADEWFELDPYLELGKNPKVVAIGECGLDYFRPTEVNDEVKRKQKNVLKDHIELAGILDKPMIIHSRPSKGTQDAYQDLIELLKEGKKKYPALRGDIHFFVGGVEEMREFVQLGFTVSFTAVVTFARDYDEVIRQTPLNSILSETDSPYVAPAPHRGQRNDPLSIPTIVKVLAEIRGEDEEVVYEAILNNSKRLFAI